MTFEEYQAAAWRTAADSGDKDRDTLISTLGLLGEAGEVAELVKKDIGHGKVIDRVQLAEEIGDVLWYVADLANRYGLGLDRIAANNVRKLKERYPDGFTPAGGQ